MRPADIDVRLVLGAYVALFVVPVVISMTQHDFWDGAVPVVVVLLWAGTIVALVLGWAWAWRLLVFIESLGLLVAIVSFDGIVFVVLAAASLLLLLSPQIRAHVTPPEGRGRREHPVDDDFAAR